MGFVKTSYKIQGTSGVTPNGTTPFSVYHGSRYTDGNLSPTGNLQLIPLATRAPEAAGESWSDLMIVHPTKKIIDLRPNRTNQSRYPSQSGRNTYVIPHADEEFDNDQLTLRKVLQPLLAKGYVDNDYVFTNSAHWGGKTVADIMGKGAPDIGHEIATKTTGKVLLYHGTSAKRWKTIQKQGLKPDQYSGLGETYVDKVEGYSKYNVYLTASIGVAEKYATRAAMLDKSKAVVLEVEVNDFTRFVLDEDAVARIVDGDRTVWFGGLMDSPVMEDGMQKWWTRKWKGTPDEDRYHKLFQTQLIKGLRREKTIAYRGSIKPSKLRVYEVYKPSAMKRDPEMEEYDAATEKTLTTLKLNPTRVAHRFLSAGVKITPMGADEMWDLVNKQRSKRKRTGVPFLDGDNFDSTWSNQSHRGRYLVAQMDGLIVGVRKFYRWDDRLDEINGWLSEHGHPTIGGKMLIGAYIAVHPDYRRRGIATLLNNALLDLLSPGDLMQLGTHEPDGKSLNRAWLSSRRSQINVLYGNRFTGYLDYDPTKVNYVITDDESFGRIW